MGLLNLFRFFRIAIILARYRAIVDTKALKIPDIVQLVLRFVPAHPEMKGLRPGERVARAMEAMGPSFIKLGQALSTRADLMGDEIAADLAMLRDKLPPFSSDEAREIIEKEFDTSLSTLFRTFEDTPVAAASIAQVHGAVTVEGERVAVKILRPGIEKAFARDIDLFFWIARWLEILRPSLRRLKPVEVISTFEESVRIEMDLRLEAAAASELKDNCRNDQGFYLPSVDWQRTSHRVFTMEWVDGTPILDRDALIAGGLDPKKIAGQLAVVFFNQAYRDGFFHADMHPGNLFVNAKGEIVPVDFGIMGRLDKKTRVYVAEILHGFLKRDYMHVAQVHFTAGYVPPHQSVGNFAQACRSIGEPIVGLPQNQISIARLLAQLFKITEDFEMETQPQLLLLQKTMVLVEGVGGTLYPEVNMWQLAEPWIEQWAKENLGAKAKAKESVSHLVEIIRRLPEHMERLEQFTACFAGEMPYEASPPSSHREPTRFFSFGSMAIGAAIAALLYYVMSNN